MNESNDAYDYSREQFREYLEGMMPDEAVTDDPNVCPIAAVFNVTSSYKAFSLDPELAEAIDYYLCHLRFLSWNEITARELLDLLDSIDELEAA